MTAISNILSNNGDLGKVYCFIHYSNNRHTCSDKYILEMLWGDNWKGYNNNSFTNGNNVTTNWDIDELPEGSVWLAI